MPRRLGEMLVLQRNVRCELVLFEACLQAGAVLAEQVGGHGAPAGGAPQLGLDDGGFHDDAAGLWAGRVRENEDVEG